MYEWYLQNDVFVLITDLLNREQLWFRKCNGCNFGQWGNLSTDWSESTFSDSKTPLTKAKYKCYSLSHGTLSWETMVENVNMVKETQMQNVASIEKSWV